MKRFRYDIRKAFELGINEHPNNVLNSLGYKIISYEPIPMGDCIILELDNIKLPIPKYLTELN